MHLQSPSHNRSIRQTGGVFDGNAQFSALNMLFWLISLFEIGKDGVPTLVLPDSGKAGEAMA